MTTLGSLGKKIDLLIVKGTSFGPHHTTLRNPESVPGTPGTPVDLTGSTIRGQIRKPAQMGGGLLLDIRTLMVNVAGGVFDWWLTDEDTGILTPGLKPTDIDSQGEWDMMWVDSTGRTRRLYYGVVSIHRGITELE